MCDATAGFGEGQAGTIRIVTDGPVALIVGDKKAVLMGKGKTTVHFTA